MSRYLWIFVLQFIIFLIVICSFLALNFQNIKFDEMENPFTIASLYSLIVLLASFFIMIIAMITIKNQYFEIDRNNLIINKLKKREIPLKDIKEVILLHKKSPIFNKKIKISDVHNTYYFLGFYQLVNASIKEIEKDGKLDIVAELNIKTKNKDNIISINKDIKFLVLVTKSDEEIDLYVNDIANFLRELSDRYRNKAKKQLPVKVFILKLWLF